MPSLSSFMDELTKIGRASRQRNKSRAGRRSMHVDTLLRKEKEGSLYKYTKLGEAVADVPKGRWERDMEAGVPVDPDYARHDSLQSELLRVKPGLFRKGDPERADVIQAEMSGLAAKSDGSEAIGVAVEDGKKRMLSEEEAAQIAAAAQGIPLDIFQALSRNIQRVPEEGLRGLMPQVQLPVLPRASQPSAGGSFVASGVPEKFAAISNRWLEHGYPEGERGLQNVPVTAKKKAGDSPSSDTASAYGQGSKMTPTWTPPETAIPSKLAALGQLVKSPTETHPTRGEGIGPKRLGGEEAIFRHQYGGHDPRPITEVETDDAYSRA